MAATACMPPLWDAIAKGNADEARSLISSGADLQFRNTVGTTLLHIAAGFSPPEIVTLLIEKGADVNATNNGSYTPLHSAVIHGQEKNVVLLLRSGADLGIVAGGKTARMMAQEKGYAGIVKILDEAEKSSSKGVAATAKDLPPPRPQRPAPLNGSALVMELKRVGAVPDHVPSLVTKMILSELDNVEGLKTVSPDDLQLLLSVEKQKDALGCDDVKCIAELGGALGSDFVIYGEIGIMGTKYNLNLTVIDTKRSQAAARVSVLVAATEDALAQSISPTVASLLAKIARDQHGARAP